MGTPNRNQLERSVIVATREYGIATTLFRNAVGSTLGVNVTDMECLALLFFRQVATPTQLSAYTGLSSGATTAMLDRLERAHLIKRQPNPKDRRGTLIVVDERSRKTIGPLFAATREAQDALLARYSDTELATIAGFITQLTAVWESSRQELR